MKRFGIICILGLAAFAAAQDVLNHIVCQGDSLTDPTLNTGYGEHVRWTNVLEQMLSRQGAFVSVDDLAQSGAKTDDLGKGMLLRYSPFLQGTPFATVILAGTNDAHLIGGITRSGSTATVTITGHSYIATEFVSILGCDQPEYNAVNASISNITANTFDFPVTGTPATPATGSNIRMYLDTARNIRAMVKWAKFGCLGCVRGQANLPAAGLEGDRYVVLYDTSSTGGAAALSGQAPTIIGSVSASEPTVWEFRTGQAGETGWGRVATSATSPTHCKRFLIVSQPYLNYSSGGDMPASPYLLFNATDGTRAMQQAAAAAEGAIYVDLYAAMRARIVSGIETQGSASWHIADGNIHFSPLGHRIVAEAIYQAIISAGWLPTLKKSQS